MSSAVKSTEKSTTLTEDRPSSPEDYNRRSPSPEEEEEEELDEFGRVKRRRQKFKTERSEEGGCDDQGDRSESDRGRREDRVQYRRHRRRSSSGSRSPRRYRRRNSDSDGTHERHRSSSRHGHHRSSSLRHHRPHYHSGSRGGDMYSEAAQYIDTEFYPSKVYIGDLENVTENEVRSIFSRFGALEDVKLVEGKDYGFITFEKKEAALAAIQSLHGTLLGARHIKVNRAKIPERNKVGFGNIPWQDEDGLMAKEAVYYSSTRRRSSTLMKMGGLNDINPPAEPNVPRRVLTSYDDL